METDKLAKKILAGLETAKRKAMKDPRSKPEYWNGDGWGSVSGVKEADDWVNRQLASYLETQLEPTIPTAVREAAVRLMNWLDWEDREYFENANDILLICQHVLGRGQG